MRVATTVGGAAVGAVAGAAVGKPSLILGVLMAGAGAYLDHPILASAGVGMALGGVTASDKRTTEVVAAGKTGLIAGTQARVLTLLDQLKGRTYVTDMLAKGAVGTAKPLALGTVDYTYGAPDSTTASYQRAMAAIGAPMGALPAAEALEQAQNLGATQNTMFDFAGVADELDLSGGPTADSLELGALSEAELLLA